MPFWLPERIRRRLLLAPEKLLGKPPSNTFFWSALSSPEMPPNLSIQTLLLAKKLLEVVEESLKIDLSFVLSRASLDSDKRVLNSPFGEHYRFIAALTKIIKPNLAIEIGTHRGLATHCLTKFSKNVITFDVKPYDEFPGTLISDKDFSQNLKQIIGDLYDERIWCTYIDLFRKADLVFLDGPKDGKFENKLLTKLLQEMKNDAILIIDDIRFLNMISLWEKIQKPKMDITSFSHFSGTGVVQI